jgi:HK97 family phage prohead protease
METKTLSLEQCDVKFAQEEGMFSGYGSVFNVKDYTNDIIMPGAFDDVIKSGQEVNLYVNHGWMRGELPVGKWSGLKEDSIGLKGESKIELRMPSGSDGYYAMKSGLATGLSIGFMLEKNGFERKSDGTRVIHKIARLKEISITDAPANKYAGITSIKSIEDIEDAIDEIKSIRDFENYLRDAGHSKSAALAIVSKTRKLFQGEPDVDEGTKIVLAKLEQIRSKLS